MGGWSRKQRTDMLAQCLPHSKDSVCIQNEAIS